MRIKDLSIGKKLGLSFGLICLLLIGFGVMSQSLINKIITSADYAQNVSMRNALIAKEMELHVIQVQQWLTDISATRGMEGFDDGFTEAESHANGFYKNREELLQYFKGVNNQVMVTQINTLGESFAVFYDMGKQMAQTYIDEGPEGGNPFMEKFDPYAAQLSTQLTEIVSGQIEGLKQDMTEIKNASTDFFTVFIVVGIFVLAFSILICYVLTRMIAKPLSRGVELAKLVANGDLSKAIVIAQQDEVGQMINALNHMREQLCIVISNIMQSSSQVTASSEELSSTAQMIAGNANNQAASLEETSASLEELSVSVDENASNAYSAEQFVSDAKGLSDQSLNTAHQGKEKVVQMTEAMESIQSSSKEISHVIGVIDDIADQTNLLALNAAIEAARAGESGKGFAVVADEVRKLAERSQIAAKDIKGKIKHSITIIETGNRLAQESSSGLDEIEASAMKVADVLNQTIDLVRNIALACNEQSNGSKQIAQTVNGLEDITQQNSATSEELASASEELTSQALSLQEMVAQFKIDSNGHLENTRTIDVNLTSKEHSRLLTV